MQHLKSVEKEIFSIYQTNEQTSELYSRHGMLLEGLFGQIS